MAHITESIAFDRRLVLGTEQYFRRMAFGDQWTKLRIGVRLSINGRNSIASQRFTVGVSADETSGYFSLRSTGYYGVSVGNAQNLTYNAGQYDTSFFRQSLTNDVSIVEKVGLSATSQAVTHATVGFTATPNAPNVFYITFTRTRATGVFQAVDTFSPTTAALSQVGRTAEQFLIDMDNEINIPAMPGLVRTTIVTGYSTTSRLPFPYVCIGWNKSTPTIEITHIAVTKFS